MHNISSVDLICGGLHLFANTRYVGDMSLWTYGHAVAMSIHVIALLWNYAAICFFKPVAYVEFE